MGRTSINLPDDLQERMRAVDEPVNWSTTAAECFERKLQELAARKKVDNMNAVVERLRASKFEGIDEDFAAGKLEGKAWAEQRATFQELERAVEYAGVECGFDEAPGADVSVAEIVALHILYGSNTDNYDRSVIPEFWESITGNAREYPSSSFVDGFCDGATEILNAVSDQL
mgnify:CR=1 FL=1